MDFITKKRKIPQNGLILIREEIYWREKRREKIMDWMNTPFRNVRSWYRVPAQFPAEKFDTSEVHACFLEGMPWNDAPTRIFACWGLPPGASAEHPAPGIVLVHGGGGTAFAEWVRLWNRRGYAAIAMDTCGHVPDLSVSSYCYPWPSHDHSGPAGWGRMEQADLPPEEQWPFHAVAAVVLAHSFFRSLPGVDPERIGINGISWGGVLTCMAAGLDDRFRFAIPVYGCGAFDEFSSQLNYEHPDVTPELRERWFSLWDPVRYLVGAQLPMLFFSGTNDFAFSPDALESSFEAVPDPRKRLSVKVAYPHNHTESWQEETIFNFADTVLAGQAVPELTAPRQEGNCLLTRICSGREIVSVGFNSTRAEGYWGDRCWNTIVPERQGDLLRVEIPRGTTAAYFQLTDAKGCCWSSPFWFRE